MRRPLHIVIGLLLLSSCATFYELNYEFNDNFERGRLDKAEEALIANERVITKKAKFLYWVNRGTLDYMTGDSESSNEHFEKAFIFGEDHRRKGGEIVASYLTNPNAEEYRGEDHEHLMLLYYKALNYIKLNDLESALVECRRLNERLYNLSDRYKSDLKYREDAFIHTLMGLIYDASGDYNNAFIAYRNAYNIYEDSYSKLFGLSAPDQLCEDLMRTAYLLGFEEELNRYERKFGTKYLHVPNRNGDLIFLWHNGYSPVKDEWSIMFSSMKGGNGIVSFENEDQGFNFPFRITNEQQGQLEDLRFFRVAFPKYVERKPTYRSAHLESRLGDYPLEMAQDINAVAFHSLNQRMMLEFSNSLLRAALKKSLEVAVSQENEGLGAVMSLINATTEKADTRNWQTLPHSIHYARVPLERGSNRIKLVAVGAHGRNASQTFAFNATGKTRFHAYQTMN